MSDVGEGLRKYLASIPEYQIQIGVFSTKTKRKTTYNVGITNAELMFIHENGSPLHHLPARPVLKMTIEYGNTLIKSVMQKALKAYVEVGEQGLEKELNKMCVRMENYAREIIYSNDGRLAPNAPSVAARKKGNHPLFDTGQLARSITCKLVRV